MRVVFFGDSLTEGIPGAAYLDALARRAAADARMRDIELVNAGVGGDTIVNLARRMDHDVVPLAPDWVVVFVGVNDAATWLLRRSFPTPWSYRTWRYFREYKGVRRAVTPERYLRGLRGLVDGMHARTDARVALCTPAASGESPGSHAWRALDRYAEAVRWVASERDCALIDVHAAFECALAGRPRRTPRQWLAAIKPLGPEDDDIETIARERGYLLTFDGTHLTSRGADLVAGALYDWLSAVVTADSTAADAPAAG